MTRTSCPTSWKCLPAVLVLVAWAAIVGAGNAQEIAVQNELGASVKITAAEIAALPHQEIALEDHGKIVRFGGVPLRLVLEKGGITLG